MAETEKVDQQFLEKQLKDTKKKLKEARRETKELRAKAEGVIKAIQPQLDFFEEQNGSWSTLFFIPEDLGFNEIQHVEKGLPVVRIYHKDDIALTKMSNNEWMIAKDGMRLSFQIKNKFDAYQALRLLGFEFEEDQSEENS